MNTINVEKLKVNLERPLMDTVLEAYDAVDFSAYTGDDVLRALEKDSISLEDYAALLSPAAQPYLEQMARRAKQETACHFGNTAGLYTPHCRSSGVESEQMPVTCLYSFLFYLLSDCKAALDTVVDTRR